MNKTIKFLIVITLFISTTAFSHLYKVERINPLKGPDLSAIPTSINEWRLLDEQTDTSASESRFLNDVLYRTYARPDGKTISLAVAYGGDQRQYFSIHAPEGCYISAGYDVTSFGVIKIAKPNLELKEMLVQGPRNRTESVQYWIVLNGKVVTNHFERKIKQFYYSIFGAKSDGILVRVSSFSSEKEFQQDYLIQRRFITALYEQLNPELRRVLFGNDAPKQS